MCPSIAETVAERENFRQEARRTKSIRRQASTAASETYHSAGAADYLLAEHFPVSSAGGLNSPKNFSQP